MFRTSFNQPVSYFAGLWPSDLVWERHVNAAAGRKMKRRKWDEWSEIFLFIHLMPSFRVLIMIVQIKNAKAWKHNRKRINQIKLSRAQCGFSLKCSLLRMWRFRHYSSAKHRDRNKTCCTIADMAWTIHMTSEPFLTPALEAMTENSFTWERQ